MSTVTAPAVRIVASTYPTERDGTIIVEAPDQEAVLGLEAKRLVAKEAQAKLGGRAGLSGVPSPYPVDANGNTDESMIFGRGNPVVGYRADWQVSAGA